MTSSVNNKDYKAMYDALKTEHNLVLKKSTIACGSALIRLKVKDAEIAKVKAQLKAKNDDLADAEREAHLASNCAKYFKGQFEAKEEELAKYKEAEKAYKTKFGLEETRLTSQEMKEMERRAREDEDEDDDRPLVPKKKSKPKKSKPKIVIDMSYNRDWYEEGYCPVCYNDISIDDEDEEAYNVCERIRYFFK